MKKLRKITILLLSSVLFSMVYGAIAFAEAPPSIGINLGGEEEPPSIQVDAADDEPSSSSSNTTPSTTPTTTPTRTTNTTNTNTDGSSSATNYQYTSTASTGPGVLLYAALPALGLVCRRKKNKDV